MYRAALGKPRFSSAIPCAHVLDKRVRLHPPPPDTRRCSTIYWSGDTDKAWKTTHGARCLEKHDVCTSRPRLKDTPMRSYSALSCTRRHTRRIPGRYPGVLRGGFETETAVVSLYCRGLRLRPRKLQARSVHVRLVLCALHRCAAAAVLATLS